MASTAGPGSDRRVRRLSWAVLALLLVAFVVAVVITANATSEDPLTDLTVYREAGSAVLHGGQVYLPSGDELVFTYPPPAALVSTVVAAPPAVVAQLSWSLATVATLAAIVAFAFAPLLRRVRPRRRVGALGALACLALLLEPIRQTLFLGQINVLLAGLVIVDISARRPWWPRGALVGIATAIKLTPGLFGVYLWISGRWRAAATSLVAFVACNLVALVVIPEATRDFWTNEIFDTGRLGDMGVATNQSLDGMVNRLLPDVARMPGWLLLVAAVGVLGMVRARRAHGNGNEVSAVALVGLLAALISPIAWTHHFVWVVVALGALAGDGRNRRRLVVAGLAAVAFVVPLPEVGDRIAQIGSGPMWSALAAPLQNSFCLAAVALVGFLPIDRVGPAREQPAREQPAREQPAREQPAREQPAAMATPVMLGSR